ncbi:MAG: hypothetical protein KDK70_40165 [Myxococcales bacterium]|nr:hypothetical protein [Myxococcales bacterium]
MAYPNFADLGELLLSYKPPTDPSVAPRCAQVTSILDSASNALEIVLGELKKDRDRPKAHRAAQAEIERAHARLAEVVPEEPSAPSTAAVNALASARMAAHAGIIQAANGCYHDADLQWDDLARHLREADRLCRRAIAIGR